MNVASLVSSARDYIINLRRYFHQHPELSLHEDQTAARVRQELAQLEIPYVNVGAHGIVATIEGNRTDQVVALRADMDALPIQEQNDHLPYKSIIPCVMHACGHDGHIAMLLGAAKILKSVQSQLNGTVKLCFQSAEEVGRGVAEILAELEQYPVKSIFGIHLWSELESGKISVEAGPRMAAGEGMEITVHGIGCHGANPDRGVDPIMTSAAILMNLTALISREVNPNHPTVLTFGKIQGGEAGNVIPEKVVIAGTMRNTNYATRDFLRQAIPRVVHGTAETFRAKADIRFNGGVPIVINDSYCSKIATAAVIDVAGEQALTHYDTIMASENFAEFLQVYPGVFAFIGVRNQSCGACYPHHHPQFDIDEDMLPIGAGLYAQYAINYFNQSES